MNHPPFGSESQGRSIHQTKSNGAAERSKLEPFDGDELLSELEDWARVLEGEPEVFQRLAVFAQAAQGDGEIDLDTLNNEPTPETSS